jgi:hypothetical protein
MTLSILDRPARPAALLLLPVLLAAAACGGGGGGGSPTDPARAVLNGRIHIIGTDTGVAGATVTAQGRTTTTGANGTFVLDDLRPEPTDATIVRDSFLPLTVGLDLVVGPNDFSIAITPDAAAACAQIGGAWNGSWVMNCPGSGGQLAISVMQNGCFVTIPVAGLGTFSGTMGAPNVQARLRLDFEPTAPGDGTQNCTRSSQGGLTFTPPSPVDILFGTGPTPCCQHGGVTLRR